MTTYEEVDKDIKDRIVEAIKAAGPAGLSQAEVAVIEFEATDNALRRLSCWRDEVIAIFDAVKPK